jgi:site-specific DNA-methyltransferase (adenine-specific)/modification methylase
MRKEVIGDATLYLGDCMEILPTLPKVDAVVTDPPYGIDVANSMSADSGRVSGHGSRRVARKSYAPSDWDRARPASVLVEMVVKQGRWAAIFGGNYFNFPPSSCWLVWDKLNGDNSYADCELVWTNWPMAVRRIQWRWHGMIREGMEERFHPTQKPLQVMGWMIDLCPKADSILDPFMGSGTTGVAAAERRRQFIGIEREESYFDIACRRIEQAYNQRPLFDAEPQRQPEQMGLA